MNPVESHRAEIKEMLDAEKRTLKLLDARMKDLEVMLADEAMPDWQRAAKRHPYIYSAIGNDGLAGIPLVDFNGEEETTQFKAAQVFEGLVTLQSDAPFIWTHIMCMQQNFDKQYASIQNSDEIGFTALQELGFIENGSGRVLFQADRENQVGELLSVPFFDTYRLYTADEPNDNTGATVFRPGAYAQGHGPNAAFELPAETALPMNGSLTVQVRPAMYNIADNAFADERLYVSLLGYKVLGD